MQLPTFTEHPLKKQVFEECKLHLYQLSVMVGKSESYLCKALRGIRPMSAKLEQQIQYIVDEVKRDREQQTAASR